MKLNLPQRFTGYLWVAALICSLAYVQYGVFTEVQRINATGTVPVYANSRLVLGIDLLLLVMLSALTWKVKSRIDRIASTQYWTVNVLTNHLKEMKDKGYFVDDDEAGADAKPPGQSSHWPWGNHHTEYLGHLEAAANKWWVLYDPSDPTTAPTNETVSDWLQSERNLSRERARAIASMLRPDGLPTGPRK